MKVVFKLYTLLPLAVVSHPIVGHGGAATKICDGEG
jgi:hypothetical protein